MGVQRIAAFSQGTNGGNRPVSCSAKRSLLPTGCWRSRQRAGIRRRSSPHRAPRHCVRLLVRTAGDALFLVGLHSLLAVACYLLIVGEIERVVLRPA